MATTWLDIVALIFQELPILIGAGVDVSNILKTGSTAVTNAQAGNTDPTDADWKAVNDIIAAARKQINS